MIRFACTIIVILGIIRSSVCDFMTNITAGCVTVIRSCNGDGNITVDENTNTSWCCDDERKFPLEGTEDCTPDVDQRSTCRLCYEFWQPQPLVSVAVIVAKDQDCPDEYTVSTFRLDGQHRTREFKMPQGNPGCANEIPFLAEDVRTVCISPRFSSDILKPACVAEGGALHVAHALEMATQTLMEGPQVGVKQDPAVQLPERRNMVTVDFVVKFDLNFLEGDEDWDDTDDFDLVAGDY